MTKPESKETVAAKKKVIANRISKDDLAKFKDYVKTAEAKDIIKNNDKKKHVSLLKSAFETKIGKPISKSTVYKVINPKE